MIRLPRAPAWALAILLAAVFVLVGIKKLEGPSAMQWAGLFAHWGYPAYAQYVVGVFEILGGLCVLIPRCRRPAAGILVAIMIGALCTHAVHGEIPRLVPPLVLGGFALALFSARLRPSGEQTPHC